MLVNLKEKTTEKGSGRRSPSSLCLPFGITISNFIITCAHSLASLPWKYRGKASKYRRLRMRDSSSLLSKFLLCCKFSFYLNNIEVFWKRREKQQKRHIRSSSKWKWIRILSFHPLTIDIAHVAPIQEKVYGVRLRNSEILISHDTRLRLFNGSKIPLASPKLHDVLRRWMNRSLIFRCSWLSIRFIRQLQEAEVKLLRSHHLKFMWNVINLVTLPSFTKNRQQFIQ
jgi:hypothetical protein